MRALARMADKRGRFRWGNKKDRVVAVIVDGDFDDDTDIIVPLPAPALTSSISEFQWNGMTLFIMRWLLLTCCMTNSTFIFRERERERKKCEKGQIWKKRSRQVRQREVDSFGFLLRRNKQRMLGVFFFFFSLSKSYTCTCV